MDELDFVACGETTYTPTQKDRDTTKMTLDHVLIKLGVQKNYYSLFRSGMSNVRPAGRMRPAKGLNAAREKIFLYVMHVARERI